jgi:hypothetical protein
VGLTPGFERAEGPVTCPGPAKKNESLKLPTKLGKNVRSLLQNPLTKRIYKNPYNFLSNETTNILTTFFQKEAQKSLQPPSKENANILAIFLSKETTRFLASLFQKEQQKCLQFSSKRNYKNPYKISTSPPQDQVATKATWFARYIFRTF